MATRKSKQTRDDGPRYTPQSHYVWMAYSDPDAPDNPPLRIKVRAALSFRERNEMVFENDTPMTVVWDMLAPYVVDWNYDDIDGEPLPPPSEEGGRQFDYVTNGTFWKIWSDLMTRSSGAVQSKRLAPDGLTPWKRTEEPDGATITNTSNSDTTAN